MNTWMTSMLFKYIHKRSLRYLWNLTWLFFIVLLFSPVQYGMSRLFILILMCWLLFGGMILFWQQPIIKSLGILLTIILSLIIIIPGYPPDTLTLRNYYIQELQTFMGTKYIWGGENQVGIDCSGLVRQGLVKANIKYGLISFNPQLIREGFSIWWYDASAQELAKGYRNKTKVIMSVDSIYGLDHSQIKIGDIAVTQDGLHTLAYIGNNTWIEADPDIKKVITIKVKYDQSIWFHAPVHIVQWQQFT